MRKSAFLFFFVFNLVFVFAQDKIFVPEEMMSNRSLYPGSMGNIQWQGNSGFYTWQDATNILRGNVNNDKKDTLYTLNSFNSLLNGAGKENVRRLPAVSWKDNVMKFNTGREYYSIVNNKLTQDHFIPAEAENTDMSETSGFLAYTIENNVYVSDGKKHHIITSDRDKGIVNGQSVHRNEFGIHKGTFWSPAGNKIAFYRMDETMVTDYPIVDITARVAELKSIKYPMAGMQSHHVTLGIYDVNSEKTTFINTGEPKEQYLTNISWSPDQRFIFIAVLNRDQNHMKLNQYDASTGNFVKTLFEEKNDRYVEPQNPMLFVPGSNDRFIWQSERDGYNHLYLYDLTGKLIKQLTSGNWIVNSLKGFDEGAKGIFYTSTEASPIEEQLYYVDLASGKRQRLTLESGMHSPVVSPDGKFFISSYSSIDTPRAVVLKNVKSGKTRKLFESPNPLKDYKLGEMSIFTIKADDNTELYCRLIKPINFDSTKKYPVFLYVYGGPHTQLVNNVWMSGGLFLQYMAQKGYVVFTLDNRGSSNRGFNFESIIHRQIGKVELADQMKGVEYLKSLPYVDANRIGVNGWSYGGFMTMNMKLSYPDVFKVAAAGGPVTDWKYYEVMYGERYMDTPEQNPEGYKAANLNEKADKLDGKLLIIHGGIDNTVVWQHSQVFLKACIDNKKQVDYFVYPTHEHNVGGIDRAHLFRKIAEYFDQNL